MLKYVIENLNKFLRTQSKHNRNIIDIIRYINTTFNVCERTMFSKLDIILSIFSKTELKGHPSNLKKLTFQL